MRLLTYILVGIGAAIAVVALALVLLDDGGQEVVEPQADSGQSVTATASSSGDAPTDQQTAADTSDAPQQADGAGVATANGVVDKTAVEIDLAQVTPDGEAVFAGKAEPFAEVTVFEGDIVLGKTTANEDGEWVVVSERALGPGEHLVSVGAKSASGETRIANLTLAIKVGETEDEQPLVALLPQSETDIPELLQSPDDRVETNAVVDAVSGADEDSKDAGTAEVDVAPPPGFTDQPVADMPVVPALAPRALSWKTDGELVIDGVSRGGARVVATAAGRAFAETAVVEGGAWRMTGKVDADRASRVMTFALHDGEGQIVATYELSVATRDLSQGLDGSKLVIVQQGDALWRIAYRSYGEGIKYVDIVRRNAAAIDDPDLIFPNQIFAIPD